ncbi:MAG: bifunctional homocysteine S-methyltransferase/methylenetetrahydrofolate reductase [Treponema sp.]|nr:bifunctional homocysteine S-methyltransferase/methylenetetrahydrofolate reductase [Treponema sp.]
MLFFDGAFGTYYIAQTNDYNPCERANITNPDAVLSIHKAYIAAGANAIKTNTFAANRGLFEDEGELRDVIAAGFRLAREAAHGTGATVYADIGGIHGEGELAAKYRQVAELFVAQGARHFLFETLAGFEELAPVLASIKEKVPDAVILASFAASADGVTAKGHRYKTLIAEAVRNPHTDGVGLNCVCGPAHILSLVRRLGSPGKPLLVMPNAGYPAYVNGRMLYQDNTAYFAEKCAELKAAGAAMLGGCCGTTPGHIAAAVRALRDPGAPEKPSRPAVVSVAARPVSGRLPRKPIAVGLDPPAKADVAYLLDAARQLKEAGVDTVTLSDSPLAKTRADSFLTAALIRRETGMDVLPHLACRDRNYIAIKGALLGASFYGIRSVLAITGDPVTHSESFRNNPGVFNFNSRELVQYIQGLNRDVLADHPFSVGGALNVNATNFDAELGRCLEKIKSGAGFLYSQPLFSAKSVSNFRQARARLDCPLYAGILPLVSYKNAVFLNNEVMGIHVPEDFTESLRDKTPEEAQAISIEFCHGLIDQVYGDADGFYLIAPLRKVGLIHRLIETCFQD